MVGVGPGDPELLTLKAVRVIEACSVIAYPITKNGKLQKSEAKQKSGAKNNQSRARDIAAAHIGEHHFELAFHIPMCVERKPARDAYDKAAAQIAERLEKGDDVAFLCEGDPFFYGSAIYLYERLAEHHSTIVIPAVSSLTACAAVAGVPLAIRNDCLKILPATLDNAHLKVELTASDAVAIIKIGRHFAKVRSLLRELELEERAILIAAATCDEQIICPLKDYKTETAPYFSIILLQRERQAWI